MQECESDRHWPVVIRQIYEMTHTMYFLSRFAPFTLELLNKYGDVLQGVVAVAAAVAAQGRSETPQDSFNTSLFADDA